MERSHQQSLEIFAASDHLDESERLALALSAAGLGVWDWDFETQETYLSDECFRLFGFHIDEFVPNKEFWQSLVHPEDWESVWRKTQKQIVSNSIKPETLQYRMRLKNGGYRWFRDIRKIVRRDAQGQPLRIVGMLSDIHEDKLEDLELQRSRYHLMFTINNAPVILFGLDREGTFTISEGKGLGRLGLVPGEAVGKSVFAMYGQLPGVSEAVKFVLEGKSNSLLVRGPDYVFDCLFLPLFSATGEVEGVTGLAVDVTNLQRSESALQLAEGGLRLVRELVNSSSDAIFVLDPVSGRILDVNQQACESLNYTEEELLRLSVTDIDARIHSPEAWKKYLANRQELRSRQGNLVFESTHVRKDGHCFPVEINSRDVHLNEKIYFIAVVRDISGRKQVEEHLRTNYQVLSSMSEGVSFINEKCEIMFTNPAMDRMFGYEPGELIGKHVSILNVRDCCENQRIRGQIHDALENEKQWEGEFQNRKKDGSTFFTRTRITRVEHAGVVCRISVQQDITPQKLAEQQMESLRDELSHFSRMAAIGELAAGVTHELNQPLTAICNSAYTIRNLLHQLSNDPRGEINQSCLRIAQTLEQQAERAGEIIRRTHNLVRNQPPHRSAVDLAQLVQEVLALLEVDLQIHQIAVLVSIQSEIQMLLVDPFQMQQVLFNLCRNSIEAMKEQETSRRLEISACMTVGGEVDLCVRDWGPGISSNVSEKLFTPFVSSKPLGLGLGLVISRRIIEAHGGQFVVISNRYPGTEIHCIFPNLQGGDTQ